MAPGQDWCLECGTAAPGRLGRRPGTRAATAVVALTLLLVAGAVTAGYAAISGDAGRDTAKPPAASGAPIAQAPPSTPVAPPPTTAAPATPATPLPTVKPPKTATPAPPVSHPATPAPTTSTPAPTTSTPTTSTPSTTPSKPAAPSIEPIDLGADAASLYDPYTRSKSSSDPADAYDGDTTTAWKVSTVGDGQEMQVGLVVDLGKKRSIKQLKLHTGTPGFRIETYAADTAQVPPDILDTRWAHLHNKSGVAKDDTVALASDSHKYRYVLLWFTTPPKKVPTVKINELTILG